MTAPRTDQPESAGLFRTVVAHARRIRHLPVFLRRLALFEESRRFTLNEARGVLVGARYRLRGSGLVAYLRHHSADTSVMDRAFLGPAYDAPAPVRRWLETLGRPVSVVDVGAHVGYFGLRLLQQFPDARIRAFEPDPLNVVMLKRCVRANGRLGTWEVVEALAGTRDARLAPQDASERAPLPPGPWEGRAAQELEMVDLFARLEGADILKLCLEGADAELLRDPRLGDARVPALVLERREPDSPRGDLLAEIAGTLERAGYLVRPRSGPDGREVETVWAWSRHLGADAP